MKIFRKGLAVLLAFAMLFAAIPMQSFATADPSSAENELIVGQATTVNYDGTNYVWLSFTPDADGYYEFYSTCENGDPQAYLYDSDEQVLAYDDDSNANFNFRIICTLVAGETYSLRVDARDVETVFDVFVNTCEPKTVQSISFDDAYILESDFEFSQDWNEELGEYGPEYKYYDYPFSYIVNYSDGSSDRSYLDYVYDDINSYQIQFTDGQSYETPWGLGVHTVTASIAELGINETFNVTVEASPVKSVVVEPIQIFENTNGEYVTDSLWDDETDDYIGESPEYFYYDSYYPQNVTITLTDGTVIEDSEFQWRDEWHRIVTFGHQDYENRWTVGNTYQIPAEIAGYEFTYDVAIINSPVESITYDPICIIENTNGYYTTENLFSEETGEYIGESPEYFRYNFPSPKNIKISLTGGTVVEGDRFEWNGKTFYLNTYSSGQSYKTPWTVGNTYEIDASIAGFNFTYSVEIIPSPVESVVVGPVQILENTNGYYKTDEIYDEETDEYIGETPKYFYYHTPDTHDVTITLKDSTVIKGTRFEWNGEEYYVHTYDPEQSYENRWSAGNTYEISAYIAGYDFTYGAEIVSSPVESITVEPIQIIENTRGGYTTDSLWDDETGEYIGETPEYFRYDIPYYDKVTITLKGGTVIEDDEFEWNGDWYNLNVEHDQSYENIWTAGNTYTVNAEIASYTFTFDVEIIPSPVESITYDPICIIENTNGYYTTDGLWDDETGEYIGKSPEYFCYHFPYPENIKITLKGGTVIEDDEFEWDGEWYYINVQESNQSYKNPWTVGNTYPMSAEIAGYKFTYDVEIVSSPIESITYDPIRILENTNGYYTIDEIYDEETGEYIGESPEYFRYHTPYPENIKINLKGGTVIEGDEFEWNGNWYSFSSLRTNQSYETRWLGGNTYQVSTKIAGYEFTYDVEIVKSPVKSVTVEPIKIIENTNGYYTTDNLWDDETGEYIGSSPEYFYYNSYYPQNVTITLTDGTVIEGSTFEWEGEDYYINDRSSGQSYETPWLAENTYQVSAEIAGFEFTYDVEIVKSPVKSITVEPIKIIENTNGYYTTDNLYDDETGNYIGESPEYFYYNSYYPQNVTITLTDGTVIEGSAFEWEGEEHHIHIGPSGQSYETRWLAGNTYQVSADIAGYEFTCDVEILKSPVKSVTVEPVQIVANTDGYYTTNSLYDEDTGDYIGESPEYFRYYTPSPHKITITLTDGTVIKEPGFNWNGDWYGVNKYSPDQSYDNQWTAGNTYQISAEIAGYEFTYDVEIVELTTNEAYEYIATDEGVIITDSFIAPETLEIPSELEGKPVIGVANLNGFDGIKHLIIPDSVKSIGDFVIDNLGSLETVTFGSGVRNLDAYMFSWSYNLKNITVSEDNPYFCSENGVLYNKNKTTVIAFPVASGNIFNVPDSVTDIEALNAGIYSELELVFGQGNANFITEDGVTYNKDKTVVLFCSKSKAGKYVMPETVTEIASKAFKDCTELTEVVVSPQVTEIVYCAFFSCRSLEKVDLPDGLKSIEAGAFENATSLQSIELPNELELIGSYAFCRSGLTSLTLPNSVKEISYASFSSSKIETLDLGQGIEIIGESAFEKTPVKSVTLPDSLTSLGEAAFKSCENLTDLFIGSGLNCISYYAFSGTAIKNLTIPGNIRYVDEGAFRNSEIETLSLTEGLETIGEAAFSGCDKLLSVIIPDSVDGIYGSAFRDCTSLANVKLGNGLKKLGACAFENCAISDLDLGSSVEILSQYSFAGSNMTEQFFPDSVTTIMYGAFMDCDQLTSIELPLSVNTIEFDAFANCTELTDVYYEGTEEDRNNMDIDPEGNEYLLGATWHYGHVNSNWSAPTPTFIIDPVTGRIGDTVTVALRTRHNPGISNLKLKVDYDSDALEFLGGQQADFAEGLFSISPTENKPISVVWSNTSLMTEDGVIALLTFRVKETASVGETDITISYNPDEIYGEDPETDKVEFATENGTVNILSYISGDVNSDGEINNKDLVLLLRYVSDWDVDIDELAADVNRNDIVDTVDLGILLRYLSNWDVELK